MSGFNNPVVGALALIRKAIRSPNYQAGTEGWTVNQDGSAEFNDVVVRGEVDVVGTDGSRVKVDSNAGQAEIELQPPDQTGATYTPAVIGTASAPDKSAQLLLTSPTETGSGTHTAQLQLEGSDGSDPNSNAYLIADKTTIIGDLEIDGVLDVQASVTIGGILSASDIAGSVSVSFTSQTSFVQAVTFPIEFDTPPVVMTNINSGLGVTSHWYSRARNITTTGFNLFVFTDTSGTAQTWSSVPVQWIAIGT